MRGNHGFIRGGEWGYAVVISQHFSRPYTSDINASLQKCVVLIFFGMYICFSIYSPVRYNKMHGMNRGLFSTVFSPRQNLWSGLQRVLDRFQELDLNLLCILGPFAIESSSMKSRFDEVIANIERQAVRVDGGLDISV